MANACEIEYTLVTDTKGKSDLWKHFSLSSHLSLNREGHWDTTYDFATSFIHFSLFSTAFWDLANSRPIHSLTLSSHIFLCLPCLHPSLCLARWFLPDLMSGRHGHTTALCVYKWHENTEWIRDRRARLRRLSNHRVRVGQPHHPLAEDEVDVNCTDKTSCELALSDGGQGFNSHRGLVAK